jgi:hypothetical protein
MTAVQFLQIDRALCLYSGTVDVRSSVSVVTRLQTGLAGLDCQQEPGVGAGIVLLADATRSTLGNQLPTQRIARCLSCRVKETYMMFSLF